MIQEFLSNEWLQALGLFLAIVTGIGVLIGFFWEKILAAIKWFMKQLKNWFAQFRKMSPNPFYEQGRITKSSNFFEQKALLHTIFDELGKGTNLSLVGKEKSGKSSLLYYVCHTGAKKGSQGHPATVQKVAKALFEKTV